MMISYTDYSNKVEESEKYSKEAYILRREVPRLKECIGLLVDCVDGGCKDDHLISEVKKIAGRVDENG